MARFVKESEIFCSIRSECSGLKLFSLRMRTTLLLIEKGAELKITISINEGIMKKDWNPRLRFILRLYVHKSFYNSTLHSTYKWFSLWFLIAFLSSFQNNTHWHFLMNVTNTRFKGKYLFRSYLLFLATEPNRGRICNSECYSSGSFIWKTGYLRNYCHSVGTLLVSTLSDLSRSGKFSRLW